MQTMWLLQQKAIPGLERKIGADGKTIAGAEKHGNQKQGWNDAKIKLVNAHSHKSLCVHH